VVRYVGEPVAVVVAADRYLAEDALEMIEVEYEPLDPVLDPRVGAHDDRLLVSERRFAYGDVDAAFKLADLRVGGEFRVSGLVGAADRGICRRRRLGSRE
jgi:2-furoyl-CoA dehydrogenase large subunit